MKVARKLSTAFHSQTNEQTEIQNQELKHYLRRYCSYRQNDWTEWLNYAEIVYNRSKHSATRQTSYILLMNYNFRFKKIIFKKSRESDSSTAMNRVKMMKIMRDDLKEKYYQTTFWQIKYHNENHQHKSYNVENLIHLFIKNLKTRRSCKKLDDHYKSLFKISNKKKDQTYELKLFEIFCVHKIFHVSLLKNYFLRFDDKSEELSLDIVDDEEKYEIERILNHHVIHRKDYYLMFWKSYSSKKVIQERASNLQNAQKIIANFE